MSINITIKPLNEDDILLSIPEIAEMAGLGYGYSDNNYCLVDRVTGSYSLLFDEKRIGRGFEVWYEGTDLCLRMPLPTTGHDIDTFYSLVEKLCKKMGVYFYQCNDETMAITDVYETVDLDKETSLRAIRHIAQAVDSGVHKYMIIFGAVNPVFIGESEIKEIDDNLDNFDSLMDRVQRKDVFYCNPRFYQMGDGKLRGIYFIRDNVPTAIPLVADYPYQKVENLHSYLVQLPDENYILYNDFVNNIPYAEYYDAGHITVNLNEKMIQDYVDNYAVDIFTLKRKKGFYWGEIIDAGYTHSNKVKKLNLDTDEINGVNHMAVFLRWADENNLLSPAVMEKCAELYVEQPDYRNIIRNHPAFGNMLRTGHFSLKARNFVKYFYQFGKGGFPSCVDKLAEKYFGTEKYNCEEFKDEAYLFVPYDESYYKNLSAYIDREWKKYNK